VQPIQQLPTVWSGQGAKHSVIVHAGNREPLGCLTIWNLVVACQAKIETYASKMRTGPS